MKTKILFFIPLAILLSVFFSPVKVYSQTQDRPEVKTNFIDQETRELEKMKTLGVKQRIMFAKLANAGERSPLKVEELYFNKNGFPVEKKRYSDSGPDMRIEYKYNSGNKLIQKNTYDSFDRLVEKEITKFDRKGKPIEVNVEIHSRKNIIVTRKLVKYDKNGFMTETQVFDGNKKLLMTEKYEYKDGVMLSTRAFNEKGKLQGIEEYEYDVMKRKIKEIETIPNQFTANDTSAAAKKAKGLDRKSEFTLKRDEKGNVIEITAPLYRQEFSFDQKGDFTRDIVYDKRNGKKQNDNAFEYNENGLLNRVIRYYPDGQPGAYITYNYEFYDNKNSKK